MSGCQKELMAAGGPYPRTCEMCGLTGPCKKGHLTDPKPSATNMAEALARELVRVARVRRHYEDIGGAGAFGLRMIDAALEAGCKAAGSNDAVSVLAAHATLKDIES